MNDPHIQEVKRRMYTMYKDFERLAIWDELPTAGLIAKYGHVMPGSHSTGDPTAVAAMRRKLSDSQIERRKWIDCVSEVVKELLDKREKTPNRQFIDRLTALVLTMRAQMGYTYERIGTCMPGITMSRERVKNYLDKGIYLVVLKAEKWNLFRD